MVDTRSRYRMLPSDWLQVRVCGGYDNYYNLRECHVLDLVQGSWSPAPSLTQARWSINALDSVFNVKALVGAFNQEEALVGAFSVIANIWMDLRFKL